MNINRLMWIISKIIIVIIFITLILLLLLNFNVISFNSSDLPLVLTLNQNEVGVKLGDSYQLEPSILPTNVHYGKIIWSSSDEKIASVNETTGFVDTHKTGDVIIKASVPMNNLEAECVIHVLNNDVLVRNVKINNDKISLATGKSYTLRYSVIPSNATTHSFDFISSDTNVAVVNENGVIKAINPGTAIITVKSKITTAKDTIIVNVYRYSNSSNNSNSNNNINNNQTYYKTKSIVLSKENLELRVGEKSKLIATINPLNAYQQVNWASSNQKIATVDSNGIITGLKEGTVTISATTIDGISKVCKVNIKNDTFNEQGINIIPKVITMEVGQNKNVEYNFYLQNISSNTIIWSSSNSLIASVSNGIISAKKSGTCIIKATSSDGNYSDYVTINVNSPNDVIELNNITFDNSSYSLSINDTITLNPIISPSNATYRLLNWTTSNRNVATVENGVVRCLNEGEVTITASSGNISSSVNINVYSINPSLITIENVNSIVNISLNKTMYLIKKIVPTNATNQNVSWVSSNNSIVTVDSNGMIKGISKGNAIITVTTFNGISASVEVKVN